MAVKFTAHHSVGTVTSCCCTSDVLDLLLIYSDASIFSNADLSHLYSALSFASPDTTSEPAPFVNLPKNFKEPDYSAGIFLTSFESIACC